MNLENKTFTIKNGVLLKFKDAKADKVVIPDGVVSIGEWAFSTSRIRYIKLPESLINIEKKAFWGCNYLKNIVIPDSVKTIGNDAFAMCEGLEQLVIGNGVEKIGCRAFLYCKDIVGNVLGKNVKSIGDSAFANCRYINRFEFSNCTNIGDSAFYCCYNMESIELGEISRIGNRTFCICHNLENFTIMESVQQICQQAFWSCSSLTLRVPEKLKESGKIGKEAFHECKKVIYI